MYRLYCRLFSLGIVVSLMILQAQGQTKYTKDDCKERSGFEYGGLAGIYIASDKTASFYSGVPSNENTIDYVFNNWYWYEEIRYLLDFNDTIFIKEYPQDMGYSPAFSFGLFLQYNFNCKTGMFVQFYYVKLRANDVVSVEVDPKDYLTEPDIRLLPIKGIEERNLIDLGVSHTFGMTKSARMIFTGGININNTLVKEHKLYVGEKDYNLVKVYGNRPYVPNSNQQLYEIRQGGIGFGAFASIGVKMEFSPSIAIEPGLSAHLMNVNLTEATGYTMQYNFYVKLLLSDILNFNY